MRQVRGEYVHDARHRFSLELRPDEALDRRLRVIAHELEARGLIAAGASTAPRFHPHATLLRMDGVEPAPAAAAAAALALAGGVEVEFDRLGTFGEGRIAFVQPADESAMQAARAAAVDRVDRASLDPLVLTRPWTPHVTLAYAIPEPTRAAARVLAEAALPIRGRWADLQVWDLDVRPTRLVHSAPIGRS